MTPVLRVEQALAVAAAIWSRIHTEDKVAVFIELLESGQPQKSAQ
jgi:hypothetical protein